LVTKKLLFGTKVIATGDGPFWQKIAKKVRPQWQ